MTDEAACIYKKGLERGLEKGRSYAQITASSLYAACREKGVPTTLDEVAAASGVQRDDIARCYRLLVNELDMEIPVVDPAEFMPKVASRAKESPKVEADALEILSKAREAGITAGVYPLALTASAIYLASILDAQNMTQASAAEAAGVTEVTVRNQCKSLRKVLKVQPGRTQRKRRPSRSELEATRSTGAEVPVRSLT